MITITNFLNSVTQSIEHLLLFEIFGVPFIVLWLGAIGIFLTLRLGFINIFGLKHAYDILRGKFTTSTSEQEVTPFQALMSSMAATIGTGSIVGVAVAISKGGPGAVFWMMVFGFFGMTVKCVEVYFGHKYRIVNKDGTISGGPFIYLKEGLKDVGFPKLGVVLSWLFLVFGFIGVIGIAGFQSNQIVVVFVDGDYNTISIKKIIISLVTTIFCAYILLGGVKRISSFADKIVPFMILLYVGSVIIMLATNLSAIKTIVSLIIEGAFDLSSGLIGFFAMVAIGARRAIFASEAGQGTSPIINATSNVKFSQRQGIINLFDPFITTWVICLATATVVIASGLYADPAYEGIGLVKKAFGTYHPALGYIVTISIMFFALTTLITDSYYFRRIAKQLKINKTVSLTIFFAFVFLAGIVNLAAIVAFADIFVLLMSVVNTFGLYFLSNMAAREFKDYMKNHKNEK